MQSCQLDRVAAYNRRVTVEVDRSNWGFFSLRFIYLFILYIERDSASACGTRDRGKESQVDLHGAQSQELDPEGWGGVLGPDLRTLRS